MVLIFKIVLRSFQLSYKQYFALLLNHEVWESETCYEDSVHPLTEFGRLKFCRVVD